MPVELTRLPSGLTIVTDAMAHCGTAAIGVHVGAGGRHEQPSEHGISHLLEHMAFKGTRRRSARDIAEEIEAVGGDLNAATSSESTAYYARVLAADVPLALDMLSDILAEPTFDPEELTREQNVIVQEIGAVDDTPDDLVFDRLQAVAFAGQPLGRPILGTPETVKSFDRDRLEAYLGRHYGAPRMVVAAAGAVEHAAIVDEAGRLFAPFARPADTTAQPARFVGGRSVEGRDLEQVHIALAWEGLPVGDADLFAAQVFNNLVGGGMSSRLFQEIREKRGLCYSVWSFHWSYADTGLFGFYAGTDAADAGELVSVAIAELKSAAAGVTEREVAKAKAQMKASLLMSLESSSARAEQLARHILVFGRPIPREEIVERIDAVTVADVRRVAARILATREPAFATLGPKGGVAAAESALGRA